MIQGMLTRVDMDMNFEQQDIQDLIAFMGTLTSEELINHEKFSDPFEAQRVHRANELKQPFTISPNPMVDKTTVEFYNPTDEVYNFRLLNTQGQALLSTSTQEGRLVLENNGLSAGLYFLEIRKGNRQKLERIVVQ